MLYWLHKKRMPFPHAGHFKQPTLTQCALGIDNGVCMTECCSMSDWVTTERARETKNAESHTHGCRHVTRVEKGIPHTAERQGKGREDRWACTYTQIHDLSSDQSNVQNRQMSPTPPINSMHSSAKSCTTIQHTYLTLWCIFKKVMLMSPRHINVLIKIIQFFLHV